MYARDRLYVTATIKQCIDTVQEQTDTIQEHMNAVQEHIDTAERKVITLNYLIGPFRGCTTCSANRETSNLLILESPRILFSHAILLY